MILSGSHFLAAAPRFIDENGWLSDPGAAAHPPTPRRRPDHKSLKAEATTCRDPGSVDWRGLFLWRSTVCSEVLVWVLLDLTHQYSDGTCFLTMQR